MLSLQLAMERRKLRRDVRLITVHIVREGGELCFILLSLAEVVVVGSHLQGRLDST